MSRIALRAENLSKAYQLGEIGTGTISRDLERWWARIRGKEDPFLKVGEVNDRSSKGESDTVWSLRDLNFEIEQGDAVGIIGRNGAGKSTLLKILSRITSPTTGRIYGNGRVASLLEVGTGFNPELTGRENIYLNGTIMGMRKSEIRRHFDAIVDFAGVERYIDTPVKRYSSGMYVRLGFAVAAHLESEILIIDEVLAVGDAEFQQKCLGKMGELSKGEGRTVLFVSHNMDSVMNLCTNGIVLKNGTVSHQGDIISCVSHYQNHELRSVANWSASQSKDYPHFSKLSYDLMGKQPNLTLKLEFELSAPSKFPSAFVAFGIKSNMGTTLMEAIPSVKPFINFRQKTLKYTCEIDVTGFIPGSYSIYAWMGASESEMYDWQDDVLRFEIIEPPMYDRTFPYHARTGFLVAQSKLIDND